MKKILSLAMAVIMLIALSTTALAAGQGSPSPVPEVPPQLENKVTGAGVTEHGEIVTVKEWKAEDTDFADANAAVEAALESKAFKDLELDPADFSGYLVASVALDGSDTSGTVVILYKDEKPDTVLYFYNEEWINAGIEPVEDEPDVFTLIFEATEDGKGFTGEVAINIAEKE